MAKITKIAFWKGHLSAFKAKTQGTTSGQLFMTNKKAFIHFGPPKPPKATFGLPIFRRVFLPVGAVS